MMGTLRFPWLPLKVRFYTRIITSDCNEGYNTNVVYILTNLL